MLPIIVAGSRPAAAVLAQKRPFNCDTSVDLYRLRHVHVNITETGRSRLPFSSTGLLNPIGSHPLPHAQQPNRHRAPRTASVSPPAISSLGGFRTPAPNRGVRGAVRHQPASENLHKGGLSSAVAECRLSARQRRRVFRRPLEGSATCPTAATTICDVATLLVRAAPRGRAEHHRFADVRQQAPRLRKSQRQLLLP